MLVSRSSKSVHECREEAHAALFVHFADAVALQHFVDAGAFFVSQMIGGDMLYIKADGLLQVAFPPLVRLTRQAVDEVDAYVLKTGPATMFYGFDCLYGIVPAVQQFQCRVVECLYSHTDAVEGEGT